MQRTRHIAKDARASLVPTRRADRAAGVIRALVATVAPLALAVLTGFGCERSDGPARDAAASTARGGLDAGETIAAAGSVDDSDGVVAAPEVPVELVRDGRSRVGVPCVAVDGPCAEHRLRVDAVSVEVRACARVESRDAPAASGERPASWRIERFEVSGLAPGVEVGVWITLVDGGGGARSIEVNGAPFEISRAMRAEGVAWIELARDGATEVATRRPDLDR